MKGGLFSAKNGTHEGKGLVEAPYEYGTLLGTSLEK